MTAAAAAAGPVAAEELQMLVRAVLSRASEQGVLLACAESCTGGLIASLLTDVEGCGGAFERGFVTYSEAAKVGMLGVDPRDLAVAGAVSEVVARAMARGAIERSDADLAVAVTGFAGPVEDGEEEGLIHLAIAARDGRFWHRECHFGKRGRDANRALATRAALEMLGEALD